jgi:hypothetical protein
MRERRWEEGAGGRAEEWVGCRARDQRSSNALISFLSLSLSLSLSRSLAMNVMYSFYIFQLPWPSSKQSLCVYIWAMRHKTTIPSLSLVIPPPSYRLSLSLSSLYLLVFSPGDANWIIGATGETIDTIYCADYYSSNSYRATRSLGVYPMPDLSACCIYMYGVCVCVCVCVENNPGEVI